MIAALVALAVAGASTASEAPPLEVLEAGQAEYDVALGRGRATGGVVLRRGAVLLRAGSASYDGRTGEVDAAGGVLLLEPGRAVAASALHAVLDGPYEAHDVVAFLKDAPLDLSRCRTIDDARRTGRNRAEVGGAAVRGESGGGASRFEIDRARLTLCDCGGGPPSWEIRAHRAVVTPGKGALLWWPVLRIKAPLPFVSGTVPVLPLPVLYLPLAERQSGLLIPAVTLGGVSGIAVAEPLFLTLGRSWDATLTAGYAFGPSAGDVAKQQRGIRGPSLDLELRWAPADGAHGQVRFFEQHSSITTWPAGVARPPGDVDRIALTLSHDQRFSDATYLRAEASLVGDPLYVEDFSGDALLRATDYRRSAVAVEHRSDALLVEGDAAYHLPLVRSFLDAGAAPPAPYGVFGTSLGVFHRLPAASATLLPTRLAGPLSASASVGVARFAPLRGGTGDEGLDGIGPGERGWAAPGIRDPGERDGQWQHGERLAATRATARAELRAPFTLGRAVELEPWAAGTALGYAFDAGQGTLGGARAVGGLVASTALRRTFGSGGAAVAHVVRPVVELRAGTAQSGPPLPTYAYDELDVAPDVLPRSASTARPGRTLSASPGAFQQVRLAVRNSLAAPAGAVSRGVAELAVGIDADLGRGKLSETWAQLGFEVGPLHVDGAARLYAFGARRPSETPRPSGGDSWLDRFTELRGNVSLADGRGDDVHAGFFAIGPGGSPALLAGLEPFFDPRVLAVDAVAQGSVGARGRASGGTLVYDALFNARPLAAPLCAGKATAPHVYQHNLSFVWDSPCRCWKAGVTAQLYECDAKPRIGFVLDLSSLTERRGW